MAIKPTIYKLRIALTDLERDYYDSLNLTLALHPSETPERMVARVLAFCLNAQSNLSFTKGLSAIDEPDIWCKAMNETIELWIDVGELAPERVKKASHKSDVVKVYSFNTKSDVWWAQSGSKFDFENVEVVRFDASKIALLSEHVQRTADWSVTITGQTAFVATQDGEVEVAWETLKERS